MTTPMCTTTKVWEKITAKLNPPNTLSSYTLLWGNPRLHHRLSIPDPAVWVRYDIKMMQQIMPEGRLLSYDDLKNTFQLPTRMFFATCNCDMRYKPNSPLKSICSHMLWSVFLISNRANRILSSLYLRISCEDDGRGTQLFHKWKVDLPSLADDDWEEGIQQYILLMISAGDRYIQLKFLHRAFLHPPKEYTQLTLIGALSAPLNWAHSSMWCGLAPLSNSSGGRWSKASTP